MPDRSGDRPRQIAWEWRILQQWRNINLLNILSIHQIVVMGILKPCNGLAICPEWALPLALWQLEYDQTPPFDPELGKQKKIDGWMHEWNTEKCTSQLQKVKVTSLLLLCLITGQKLFCCNARWENKMFGVLHKYYWNNKYFSTFMQSHHCISTFEWSTRIQWNETNSGTPNLCST